MQGQLGLDRKKPVITVIPNEDGTLLKVYLGFLVYKIIPNDKASFLYRLLVGELAANLRISIAQLIVAFDFSRVTIMRYRDAVETSQGNEIELFEKLQGYHRKNTKLTLNVEHYIIERFPVIYAENKTRFNKQLRIEIEERFNVELSRESVRRIITPIRKQIDQSEITAEKVEERTSQTVAATVESESQEQEITDNHGVNDETVSATETSIEIFETCDSSDTHPSYYVDKEKTGDFFAHAGVLVLNFWIDNFLCSIEKWHSVFLQWIYQILLGSINFEQCRYMVRNELSRLIGKSALSVSASRLMLKEISEKHLKECLKQIFDASLNCIRYRWEDKPYYFYIDGHFDPYYGQLEILKGWNCILNRCMKGCNHYVIHDSQGYPLFKELKDNFDDFRIFLKNVLEKMKSFMGDIPFGIVFDRGGFAEDLFLHYNEAGIYFITWEKFFDIDKESELDFNSPVIIEREINEVGNYKQIDYLCAETTYRVGDKLRCRKIVIRTEEKESDDTINYFYASILTNDPQINHQHLLERMLGRFTNQENDFKYEKKHFGLDSITSYASLPEKSIQAEIDKKKGQHEALKQQQKEIKTRIEKLYNDLGVKRLTKKRIERIRNDKENPVEYEKLNQILSVKPQLEHLQALIPKEEKKMKRLEKIEAKGYIQLDYRRKLVLDHVKFMARNSFYDAIMEFRKYYTNLRDLHVVFRKLICSAGIIEENDDSLTVTLICPYFEGRALEAIKYFLEALNKQKPILLDGSKRKLMFDVSS